MEEKLYNLEQIEMMSGGNVEFIDKMVNLFMSITPELLNKIKTGLIENDFEEIKSSSHKMKPSIDMMGIASLKNEIRNIERMATENIGGMPLKEAIDNLDIILNKVLAQLKNH